MGSIGLDLRHVKTELFQKTLDVRTTPIPTVSNMGISHNYSTPAEIRVKKNYTFQVQFRDYTPSH
jgi:hypothetical protein